MRVALYAGDRLYTSAETVEDGDSLEEIERCVMIVLTVFKDVIMGGKLIPKIISGERPKEYKIIFEGLPDATKDPNLN